MDRPTVEIPKIENVARSAPVPIIRCGCCNKPDKNPVEKECTALGSVVPEMGFWQRLKYFLTGEIPKEAKVGPIPDPPIMPEGIDPVLVSKEARASYTTFAGCDVKLIFASGLGEDATRKEIVSRAVSNTAHSGKSPKEIVTEGQDEYNEHCFTLAEAQAISVKTVWGVEDKSNEFGIEDRREVVKSVGSLICIMFDRDAYNQIKEVEQPVHLVILAANEYGDLSSFVLPNFKVTSWRWAISVDDLVSESVMTYEADEPMYWQWVRFGGKRI